MGFFAHVAGFFTDDAVGCQKTHTLFSRLYRSGEYDDEASELRHRRERLLALRQKRAAAADGV